MVSGSAHANSRKPMKPQNASTWGFLRKTQSKLQKTKA